MRICIPTIVKNTLNKRKDGSYGIDGFGASQYLELIDIFSRTYGRNSTFHLTNHRIECIERMKNNQSDFSSFYLPIFKDTEHFSIPTSIMSTKLAFLTGYDLMRKPVKPRQCADVLINISLLDPLTYFWSFIVTIILVLFISLKIWATMKTKEKKTKHVWKHISKELMSLYYGNSDKFRLICLLFTILSFTLVNSFKILYKTSQIAVEEPFVVSDYEQLLYHETAKPLFCDLYVRISQEFLNPPVGSLREKIRDKVIKSGQAGHNFTCFIKVLNQFLANLYRGMHERNDVIFGTTSTIRMLNTAVCGYAPEDELWRFFFFSDPSESESLYGFSVSIFYSNKKFYAHRMTKLIEQHILSQYMFITMDMSIIVRRLRETSANHFYLQQAVCRHYEPMDEEIDVTPLSSRYFGPFTNVTLVLLFFALIALAFEILHN